MSAENALKRLFESTRTISYGAAVLIFLGGCSGAVDNELSWIKVSDSSNRLSVRDMACTAESALLVGDAGLVDSPNPGKVKWHSETVFLVASVKDQSLDKVFSSAINPNDRKKERSVSLRHGMPIMISAPDPSTSYVLAERYLTQNMKESEAYLMRATGGWQDWTGPLAAPRDLIGIVFTTDQIGFGWSHNSVYRTEDGGSTWKQASLPFRVARGRQYAVVGGDGYLWMITDTAPRQIGRVSPELRVENFVLKGFSEIYDLAVLADGTVAALGFAKPRRLIFNSISVGSEGLRAQKLASFWYSYPRFLRTSGKYGLFVQAKPEGFNASYKLWLSRGDRTRWRPTSLPAQPIRAACVSDNGFVWLETPTGIYRSVRE